MVEPPRLITTALLADLPEEAKLLLGADLFSSPPWLRAVEASALRRLERAQYCAIANGERILALITLRRRLSRVRPLTSPYTALWQPLLAENLSGADTSLIAAGLAQLIKSDGAPRFNAMPENQELRRLFNAVPGRLALHHHHFGNWYLPVAGQTYETYLAARPGALREAIQRRTRQLCGRDGADFKTYDDAGSLAQGMEAYGAVYEKSWKRAEPFPGFLPRLSQELAPLSILRLGVLWLGNQPIAAQIWALYRGQAALLKLAHVEAERARSPGTVLTALMIARLLGEGNVSELDFGRGGDPYKQAWTGSLRSRMGVVLADRFSPTGALALTRQQLAQLLRGDAGQQT